MCKTILPNSKQIGLFYCFWPLINQKVPSDANKRLLIGIDVLPRRESGEWMLKTICKEVTMTVATYEAFFPDQNSPTMTAHINVISDDGDGFIAKAFYFTHPGEIMRPEDIHKDGHIRSETADTLEGAKQKLHEALSMEYGPLVVVEIE
jgi:hypothetical protein